MLTGAHMHEALSLVEDTFAGVERQAVYLLRQRSTVAQIDIVSAWS